MRSKPLLLLAVLLLLLLSACQEMQPTSVESPDIDTVRLQITPGLTHWLPKVAECANPLPNFGIITEILPLKSLDLAQADLILRPGTPAAEDPFVAVMGTEHLVLIAGRDVPLSSLSLKSIQAIYSAKATHWDDLPETAYQGIQDDQLIQTLSFPDGHEVNSLFVEKYLASEPPASQPLTYSTSEYLAALLEEHPQAIGYGFESQIPENAQRLRVSDLEEDSTRVFVLAVTAGQPVGGLQNLLLCLQEIP